MDCFVEIYQNIVSIFRYAMQLQYYNMVLGFRSAFSMGIILSLLLVPVANIDPAHALTLTNLTSSLDNTTATLTTSIINATASTNVTDTNVSGSVNNTLGLPLPNETIPISVSSNVAGTEIFANGTLITSVNGVNMSFYFDPKGPGKPAAGNTVSLTVDADSLSGSPISGLYIELQDTTGKDIATGYTPVTFSVTSGQQYIVYANNYQNFQFNHWDNGSTNPSRSITLTQSTTITAFYSTGTTSTAPQPPTGLSATAVSPSQINLSWTAPSNNGGSAITGYKIERSSDGGSTWSVIASNTGSTGTTYSDTGLTAGTAYTYRVSAINSVGTSSPSNTASATTNSSGGGSTSNSIVLNNVQSTSGTASLSPYQFTLSNFNVGTGSDLLLVVGVSANNNNVASVTFGGMPLTQAVSSFNNNDAEFWYLKNPSGIGNVVVTMSGSTSAVVGAYAFSGINQTQPIPTHVAKHNTSAGSPTISITTAYPNDWVLDLPSIYGGSTLGSPSCTQEWNGNIPNAITGASSTQIVPAPTTTTCKWTASNNDLYDDVAIEVKADTQSGTTNTATPPSSPTGLTANTVSSSQINLSWSTPSSNGGSPITGYEIERSTNGSAFSVLAQNTGNTNTTYSDTGLVPSTTYTYRVSAINSAGTSSPSNTASATTQASATTAHLSQVQSGLVASDSLTNETMSQQQLQANPGYWTYFGSAPPEHAPYSFNRDTQGLHIGVQAPKDGTWAGFFAMSQNHNAELWSAKVTNPVRTISSTQDGYENGMYVQTSNGLINYVTCTTLTNNQATIWAVFSATGNTNQVTSETLLWVDNSANQPLTHDCTIITNGNNYLKVYLDGNMVYTSNNLNLQMPEPFNDFLEPETSYAGQELVGTFTNYYVTTNETAKVINLPVTAARVDLDDPSGNVLATSQVMGGTATLDVGKYNFPIAGTIKVYDLSNAIIESSSESVYGGDVYSGS